MTEDKARGADAASVKAFPPSQPERGVWHTITRIEKYHDGIIDGNPDEVIEREGNLLCDDGIDAMLNLLAKGVGTTYSTLANAYVAMGTNAGAADHTDTTLGTETDRKQASAVVTNQSVAFSAAFDDDTSQVAWAEVGVFNGTPAGDMLNHVVSALGTKAAGATWVLTITITIS